MARDLIRQKWNVHCSNSRKKGCSPLTYDEYKQKLLDAGITADQVGKSVEHYHLSRYTDSGDYTVNSCRFITALKNLHEMRSNGGLARMAEKRRGRTKENDPSIANSAKKRMGRKATAAEIAKRVAALTGRTKESHAGVAIAAEKNSKPFAFKDPNGITHAGVNLEEFCKQHGLLGNAMNKLKNGRLKSYHGWKAASIEISPA